MASRLSPQRLQDLTGLAAGLLLASALLIVIPEGFHVSAETASGGDAFADDPITLGAAVLLGFIFMLILEGLGVGHDVHEEHHDHVEGHGHGHVHHPTSFSTLAVGLTVHALADGLAIAAAAIAGESAFSFLVALAVVLHRIPAAFSLGVFALHETSDSRRAFGGVAAFAVATPLAVLLTYVLLEDATDRLVALALLFSAGTFVYVATVDTLPSLHNPETGRRSAALVVAGALLFSAVFFAFDSTGSLDHSHVPGDTHEDDHDVDHDDDHEGAEEEGS